MSDTTLPRPIRMTRHGIWGALGTLATGGATVTAPHSDTITAALLTIAGGVVIAVIGPFATAWARNLIRRKDYRNEQEALADHLINEMSDLRTEMADLRRDNESLREENTRLRRRSR